MARLSYLEQWFDAQKAIIKSPTGVQELELDADQMIEYVATFVQFNDVVGSLDDSSTRKFKIRSDVREGRLICLHIDLIENKD